MILASVAIPGVFFTKLFWDTEPPEPPHYFAAQRECQNAALLQMIQAAVSEEYAEMGPILVAPRPEGQEMAEANLFAFANETRQQNAPSEASDRLPITAVPRLRQCHGWMQFTGEELLNRLPKKLLPPYMEIDRVKRSIERGAHYVGVVYEFIEEGENDRAVIGTVLDFLWHVGFSHCSSPKADNWKSGVLVDASDIVQPNGYAWSRKRYGTVTVGQILWSA